MKTNKITVVPRLRFPEFYNNGEWKIEKQKWKPNKVVFSKDERGDTDPIQTDVTDSSYFFDNEDAISFDLKKKKE